jgi:hypothetical protein
MSVNVFPPASGGGGGGSAPLPGATTEVVKGKFKLFATANTPLEPGSYVATVLASSSGGTDLDSKKLTSKAVGSLKAGVTTLETVTESEAGVAFFAKPNVGNLPTVSSPNGAVPFNGNSEDYAVNGYDTTYSHSFSTPTYSYIFMTGRFQETTGPYRSKTWAFRSSDGLNWSETLAQSSPSNQSESQWRKPSYVSYSDGMYRFVYSARSSTNYQQPLYFESADGNSFTQTTLSSTTSQTYYQDNDVPNVVYKYGGSWFFLGSTGTNGRSMKMSSITGQATNIQASLPDFYAGTYAASGFGATAGHEFVATQFRIFKTTDSWATQTSADKQTIFGTNNFQASCGGYGNGYYALNNQYVNNGYHYSTDLVNWTTATTPFSSGTLNSLVYDPRLNRWLASTASQLDRIAYSTTGSPTSWSYWSSNQVGWNSELFPTDSTSGRVYGRNASGSKYVFSFIPFSTSMTGTSQSWSEDMVMTSAAGNVGGSITLIGGYGTSSGSNNQMLVRATNELDFTEVASPFTSADRYITQIAWDQTNLQFVVVTINGAMATSPDGTTWTLRGSTQDAGDTGSNANYARVNSQNGVTQIPGRTNPMSRTTLADLSDVARVNSQYSNQSSQVVFAVEEAGEIYIVQSDGTLFRQTSTTPVFDVANSISTGATHTSASNGTRLPMKKVNGVWFAFSTNGTARYSTNFTTWQPLNADIIRVQDIDFDVTNSRWIAVGPSSIAYSSDLTNWFGVTSTSPENHRSALRITDKAIGFASFVSSTTPTQKNNLSQTEEYGVLYYSSDLENL